MMNYEISEGEYVHERRKDAAGRAAYSALKKLSQGYGITPGDLDDFFKTKDAERELFRKIIHDFRHEHRSDVSDPEFENYASAQLREIKRYIDELSRFDDKF